MLSLVALMLCPATEARSQTVMIAPHSAWVNSTDSTYFAQPRPQFERLVIKAAMADTARQLFIEAYTEKKLLQVRLEESRTAAEQNLFIAIGAGVLAAVALLLR